MQERTRAAALFLFAVCISTARSTADDSTHCEAAVKRVQEAVVTEVHALVNARRAACQLLSLSPSMREGKPQAVRDIAQNNFDKAVEASRAAYSAAAGCDTSRVKRPQVTDHSPANASSYEICLHSDDEDCLRYRGVEGWACLVRNATRSLARLEGPCAHLLEDLDCENLRVAEDPDDVQVVDDDDEAFIPADLDPACRDAYLEFKVAEREQERAQKRVTALAPKFGAAGPKGTAVFNRAREDSERATQKRYEAERNLKTCQKRPVDDAGSPGDEMAQREGKSPQVRPCITDEANAFARMAGSWKSSPGPKVTINGSCERAGGDIRSRRVL